MDLRTSFERHSPIISKSDLSTGNLYLRDRVVQAWWKNDVLGRPMKKFTRETWIFPDKKQAAEGFTDMAERFNE